MGGLGNLLEASVSLLTTAAVAAAVEAAVAARLVESVGWELSGVCVVAAALTKGPVGLFPLAAPTMFWLIAGPRRAWAALGGQWVTVVLCGFALFSFDAPRASLAQYLDQQVLAWLGGRREIGAGSWTIIIQLVSGVLAPMILTGGLIVAAARRFVRPPQPQLGRAAALFLLGLAGTLPIVASVKQAGHYLVPAVPLYALAAASLFAPTVAAASERFARALANASSTGLSVVVLLVGDWRLVHAVAGARPPETGGSRYPFHRRAEGDEIGNCPESNGDWGLHGWFERRFDVSLDATHGPQREWFLATRHLRRCVLRLTAQPQPTRAGSLF